MFCKSFEIYQVADHSIPFTSTLFFSQVLHFVIFGTFCKTLEIYQVADHSIPLINKYIVLHSSFTFCYIWIACAQPQLVEAARRLYLERSARLLKFIKLLICLDYHGKVYC